MIKRKFPLPNVVLSEYFKIENIIDVHPYGNGHINNTYLVVFPTCKYIIQKINDDVFSNPFAVMNNIELITAHIRKNVIYNGQDARTCVLHPASHTHRQMSDEQLVEAGVAPDLIRLSVGIENVDDIIADLAQAIEKAD